MHKPTLIATVLLAALALAAWGSATIGPTYFGTTSFPDVQVPMAVSATAGAALGWILLVVMDRRRDSETRCRACGHILRGLSEPRCPECGEWI